MVHRFVNAGWVLQVDRSQDGRYLLAAGVSNVHDAAVLAVLDAFAPDGSSPEETDSPFRCVNCPVGRPVRYMVLPRSELNRATGRALLNQKLAVQPDGTIVVRIPQDTTIDAVGTVYEITPTFELMRATHSDVYWYWHSASGTIGEDWPFRRELPRTIGFENHDLGGGRVAAAHRAGCDRTGRQQLTRFDALPSERCVDHFELA